MQYECIEKHIFQAFQIISDFFSQTLSHPCILKFKLHNFCNLLPYFGKKKQVTTVKFLVKEQNVSVIFIDIN